MVGMHLVIEKLALPVGFGSSNRTSTAAEELYLNTCAFMLLVADLLWWFSCDRTRSRRPSFRGPQMDATESLLGLLFEI